MTTTATRIRDAIATRLGTLPGYVGSVRKTPVPQLQPDKLPSLAVWTLTERLGPDGDANAGEPRFVSEITIGISDTRGFADPAVLDGSIDDAVDLIEATLLSDPSFVGFGGAPFFEAVSGVTRRRLYPQDGETYFVELRLEMTFVVRVGFDPVVPDDLVKVTITSEFPPVSGHAPRARIILPTS